MRLSHYFLPLIKEIPSEAQIASHRLMLRAGMIRQLSAGIYNWLPFGYKVLRKIENIVRQEMDRAGAQELLMPTIQPAELWEESGRYDAYGEEMLRITDRGERRMLYGPTNEEVICDIFRKSVKSYKALPKNLYHIQWKFRDEVRPRFGVMRGREFLMKDAYSFDVDEAGAKRSYDAMYEAYIRAFRRMGLRAIPVKAATGAIGGDMSHEFQVMADTGESELFYDSAWDALLAAETPDIAAMRGLYAAADDQHDPMNCPVPEGRLKKGRGIEVGHIFYLGKKYSSAMNAKVSGPGGEDITVEMGCYGIGVSRLVGAVIEAGHDDLGIIWPEEVAPFKVGLINIRMDNEACTAAAEKLYAELNAKGIDVLYDDTDVRAGEKFAGMDLIGLPWQVILGPKGVEKGVAEVKNRRTGEKSEIPLDKVIASLFTSV